LKGENVRKFKVSLIRLGYTIVQAESKVAVAEEVNALTESGIHWLSEEDGLPGSYLVTFIEAADE